MCVCNLVTNSKKENNESAISAYDESNRNNLGPLQEAAANRTEYRTLGNDKDFSKNGDSDKFYA